MKVVSFFLLSLVALTGRAQTAEPLTFRERTHDFGEIVESAGPVSFEFTFTNTSPQPVKIMAVHASCGCTTPGWTKDPVQPGKTGFVKASFNPAGRPGFFNKSLTVTTDAGGAPIILQINGAVTSARVTNSNEYPVAIGSLKLKSRSFTMGTVYINRDPAFKVFQILNDGDKPLKFLSVSSPAYMAIALPEVLQPNQQGSIKVTYDAKARNTYGFVSDNISLTTDDPAEPVKSLTVFATLEEYYATPTPEELKTAPKAVLGEQSVDAGQFPAGSTLERTVTIYNRGKKELKIKAIQGNCACISAKADKLSLRAGDSTRIHIQFKPQTRGGTQQKAIMVYTNDPRSPVQTVNVSAYINE